MVASEHTNMIEGRQQFIVTVILDPYEAAEDGSTDDDLAALDEEDGSGW